MDQMEETRAVLANAHALRVQMTFWTPEECEAVAAKILAYARKVCKEDEEIVQANLLAALIRSLEEELGYFEKQAIDRLKAETPRT